jgi:Uma2 family endonuclease
MVLEAPAPPAISLSRRIYPERGLDAEAWWALDTGDDRYELFYGMAVLMAPPLFDHQMAVVALTAALYAFARTQGGVAFVAPFGVALADNLGFEPDAGYISPERRRLVTKRGMEGAPDVVVEVLSPSTRTYDRYHKLPAYLAVGVQEVWLVDTEERTVTVHVANGERSVPFGEAIPSRIVDAGDGGLGEALDS